MSGSDVYPRAIRLHCLIKAGQGVNSTLAADLFEVSQRHAQRIFDYLRDTLQAPLEYDAQRRSFFYTDPTFDLPAAILTEGEAVGLIVAHESVLRRQGTPMGRSLKRAVDKLRHLLPDSMSVDVDALMTQMSFVPTPARAVPDDILETVALALEKRETVRIDYHAASADNTTSRSIDVYHMTQFRGDWYAVAWCHLRRALRTFALSRVQSAERLGGHYVIPDTFSAAAHFKDSLGIEAGQERHQVVLLFDADQARWVGERTWHPSQSLARHADGSLTLTLQVNLSMELRQWVLSYGRHVQVLGPAALRDEIAAEAAAMALLYRDRAATSE